MRSKDELLQQRKIQEEQNEQMMAHARAKKQKMQEMEADKKKNIQPTEGEIEEMNHAEMLRKKVIKGIMQHKFIIRGAV